MERTKKKIWKYQEEKGKWTEKSKCSPQKMSGAYKYVEDYWLDIIKNVNQYEKKRELQFSHKFFSDGRIAKGLKLYKKGHIKSYDITKVNRGDVKAEAESEDGDKTYTVVFKNWNPEGLLRRRYEREKYIKNLFARCECKDHTFGHYRSNTNIFCKHISAVWWLLQEEFNAPKIFVTPKEKRYGHKKAEAEDMLRVRGVPMKKFANQLNVVKLNEFRGMDTALSLSIHRKDHKTNEDVQKPWWITFTDVGDVDGIISSMEEIKRQMPHEVEEKKEGKLNFYNFEETLVTY